MKNFNVVSAALAMICIAEFATARRVESQQVGLAPLEVRVSGSPSALFALGRTQLVYEVHVTNFGVAPVEIQQIAAVGADGKVLGTWGGQALADRTTRIGGIMDANPAKRLEVLNLAPGIRIVTYVWATLPSGLQEPASIHHTVITKTNPVYDTIITTAVALVANDQPAIAAPVTAGTWVAIRGPSPSSGHRLSIVATNGEATIPQRFAVDWAKLGSDGKLFKGDSTVPENWYGYGTEIRAAAAGTVVWVKDGEPEHPAMTFRAPPVVEADKAMGNSVMVDMGNGQFATYAHLKPGSVQVKVGDRVAAGQPIGALGNSGNSLAPHLHFHISSAGGPLAGEGLPYRLSHFELVGRVPNTAMLLGGGAWAANAAQPARVVEGESPLENMVVRFGGTP